MVNEFRIAAFWSDVHDLFPVLTGSAIPNSTQSVLVLNTFWGTHVMLNVVWSMYMNLWAHYFFKINCKREFVLEDLFLILDKISWIWQNLILFQRVCLLSFSNRSRKRWPLKGTVHIGFFTYPQKCQCWHFRLYCVNTKKKSSDKMLPPVGIETGPPIASDSKSKDSCFSHFVLD